VVDSAKHRRENTSKGEQEAYSEQGKCVGIVLLLNGKQEAGNRGEQRGTAGNSREQRAHGSGERLSPYIALSDH